MALFLGYFIIISMEWGRMGDKQVYETSHLGLETPVLFYEYFKNIIELIMHAILYATFFFLHELI